MTLGKRGSASASEQGHTREPESPQQGTSHHGDNLTPKTTENKTLNSDRKPSGRNSNVNGQPEGARRSPRKSQGILGPAIAAATAGTNPTTPQKLKTSSSAGRSSVKQPFSNYSGPVMDGNYAGPNFHHSPAPAVLPAPSFGHSKAAAKETNHHNVTAFDSFDSFMQAISSSASGNKKPEVPLRTRPSTDARPISSAVHEGFYTNANGASPHRPTSQPSSVPTLTTDPSPQPRFYDVNGVARPMS